MAAAMKENKPSLDQEFQWQAESIARLSMQNSPAYKSAVQAALKSLRELHSKVKKELGSK